MPRLVDKWEDEMIEAGALIHFTEGEDETQYTRTYFAYLKGKLYSTASITEQIIPPED